MENLQFKVVSTEKELQDAYHIREIVFIDEQQVPEHLEMDEYDETAIHFIGYLDHKPIATARIRSYASPTIAKVERVAVLKEHRGSNIGNGLMRFIEQEAMKLGFHQFKLNAQRYAEDFYLKLGYETVSEPFDEAGIEHIAMEKK